jgi:glycosyltransferase involved in cell wall biosynthesis
VRNRHGIPQDAVVAGFVGRLVRDKGIVELADAWEKVSASIPNAWLLIAGPWEPRDPVPDSTRRKLEGSERVVLAGMQSDMAAFYAAMDLVVLPTYREGFPNVPLEAASMELPTIVSNVTGCVDAVVNGVTGTVVEVRDADSLAKAMTMYLSNESLRRAHGQAGRTRVLADFRPAKIWEALRAEYIRLLQSRGVESSAAGS